MKKKITKSLSFILVLVLMLSVFSMAAAAAEHIHDYNVTTGHEYGWVNDNEHSKLEVHMHICGCGAMFKEHHGDPKNESHSPLAGSQVNKGSYWDNGYTYTVYQYTCRYCNHTYTKKEISIPMLTSTEQTE